MVMQIKHLVLIYTRNRTFFNQINSYLGTFIQQTLFTDTAVILSLLDLRSITGCPGGTRSVCTSAFRAKIKLQCIFIGKRPFIITSKHGKTILFFHHNPFLTQKARVHILRKYIGSCS